MGELPGGNVLFVYTDVVGSTRLHARAGAVAAPSSTRSPR